MAHVMRWMRGSMRWDVGALDGPSRLPVSDDYCDCVNV
jgi:hypothetical protein